MTIRPGDAVDAFVPATVTCLGAPGVSAATSELLGGPVPRRGENPGTSDVPAWQANVWKVRRGLGSGFADPDLSLHLKVARESGQAPA